ncbi:hypothetical protein Ciccas_010624 [Cichlidogyrus casuarinus]|uniref:Uncharacterized protein n=1 Tax=Cichlidogyrus casuarinus TaxID=1844966 RepID=A0ABD2PU07_9PLAT
MVPNIMFSAAGMYPKVVVRFGQLRNGTPRPLRVEMPERLRNDEIMRVTQQATYQLKNVVNAYRCLTQQQIEERRQRDQELKKQQLPMAVEDEGEENENERNKENKCPRVTGTKLERARRATELV